MACQRGKPVDHTITQASPAETQQVEELYELFQESAVASYHHSSDGGNSKVHNYYNVTYINNNGNIGNLVGGGSVSSWAAALTTATAQPANTLQSEQTQQGNIARIEANDPAFISAKLAPGVDFGKKAVSRLYKAQKYVNAERGIIIYGQCSSTVQSISHVATLGCSHKRSKLVTFLFDFSLQEDEPALKWPPIVHLYEIESLIRQLGPGYECAREKVPMKKFSHYLYVIKKYGTRLSNRGSQEWSNLIQSALNSSDASINKGQPSLLGPQLVTQALGITLQAAALL